MKFGLYGLHKGDNVPRDARPAGAGRRSRRLRVAVGGRPHRAADRRARRADEPRLEAVVALAHLAAVTSAVRLGFGVIVLPQRQPVLLAKQLASVDVLSGGRLIVGFGVGYVEAGCARWASSCRAGRGVRDEYLDAMLALWDEPIPEFSGEHVSFSGVMSRPTPGPAPAPAGR